jgi:hypothetical protein
VWILVLVLGGGHLDNTYVLNLDLYLNLYMFSLVDISKFFQSWIIIRAHRRHNYTVLN